MSDKPDANLPGVLHDADLDKLVACLEAASVDSSQNTTTVIDELINILSNSRELISTNIPGRVLFDEILGLLKGPGHQGSIDVLRQSFRLCAGVLKGESKLSSYFWQINDLRCAQEKSPISELLFSIPVAYSAASGDGLVSVLPAQNNTSRGDTFEDTFERLLQHALSPEGGDSQLQELALLCRNSIDADTHEYAAIFWLTSACYISNLCRQQLRQSPAHRYVLRQIEVVIQQHVRNVDTAVLDPEGITLVEKSLCNMLSCIACERPGDPLFERLESRFRMRYSLQQLAISEAADNDSLLGAGTSDLVRKIARLKLDIDAAPGAAGEQTASLFKALSEVRDACAMLLGQSFLADLDRASMRLDSYERGDGALSDLEDCIAVLICIEDVISEGYVAETAGSQRRSNEPDEGELDACIIAEMIAMLKPVHSSVNADTESEPVDREWLAVVLADIASLSTFQSDEFLTRQLALVKSQLSSDETSTELLQQLASTVIAYLLTLQQGSATDEGREEIHVCVRRLRDAHVHVEPPVDLAELASQNRDLLIQEDQEPVTDSAYVGHSDAPDSEAIVETPLSSLEFGEKCNGYIDTIQLALDTALGSFGNLAPDKTVTGALEHLHQVVKSTEHESLLELIEPLSQVLNSAEQAGSSLSQSDTLLIQEAIVAITIGVDAVANEQSMPALVADVAQRITELAVDESLQARGGFEAAGLIDVFVEEGEDLAQRLFELFQRWRSAPQGATRLQGDIKRLLHTLKGSADTVQLPHIAQLAHGLETYLARNDSLNTASSDFFDVSTEAVEVILDDIDRVRNREPVLLRDDTMSRLGGVVITDLGTAVQPGTENSAGSVDTLVFGDKKSEATDRKIESIDKTPAFGSTKYFDRLEKTQRRLSSQFWKSRELQSSLQARLSEMQSSLQSTVYLLGKPDDAGNAGLSPVVSESLNDLQHLQTQFQHTLEQLEAVDDQQLTEVMELQSMVATTDLVSVEHIELRAEALIQHLSEFYRKPVRLEFTGAELELDRKLFGDLYKPLEQLITNAVVHGVEDSGVRINNRKSEHAVLHITVEKNQNHVVITVGDDGAGVDFDQLRTLAKQRADYDPRCTNTDLLRTIVEQGMSTSKTVDRSAGRGVGLDIVKEWVFSKYGELTVSTSPETGTTFKITIPCTHEAVSVMVVRHDNSFFAIDIDKIVEIKEREETGVSLGSLTGSDSKESRATLCCRADRGEFELNVDAVIGRRMVKFTTEHRFMNAGGYYRGCGVIDNNQVVLRVDLNRLPGAQNNMQLTATADNRVKSDKVEQASVLIVDDSVTIRASFGRAMQSAGYEIVLARNGLEAMEYLETHQPEVIILDLEMPLMDGYELGTYIRKEPRLKRSALVVVSSKPRSVVGDWLTAVNADAYYEKPCSESTIAGLVADLV